MDTNLRYTEIRHEIRACRLLVPRWRLLANCDYLGLADLGFVEALLQQLLTLGNLCVSGDLADTQVVIFENFETALLLNFMVHTKRAPADYRLLVAPGGQRQQPPLCSLAGEALIVDEAIDFLERRL